MQSEEDRDYETRFENEYYERQEELRQAQEPSIPDHLLKALCGVQRYYVQWGISGAAHDLVPAERGDVVKYEEVIAALMWAQAAADIDRVSGRREP